MTLRGVNSAVMSEEETVSSANGKLAEQSCCFDEPDWMRSVPSRRPLTAGVGQG